MTERALQCVKLSVSTPVGESIPCLSCTDTPPAMAWALPELAGRAPTVLQALQLGLPPTPNTAFPAPVDATRAQLLRRFRVLHDAFLSGRSAGEAFAAITAAAVASDASPPRLASPLRSQDSEFLSRLELEWLDIVAAGVDTKLLQGPERGHSTSGLVSRPAAAISELRLKFVEALRSSNEHRRLIRDALAAASGTLNGHVDAEGQVFLHGTGLGPVTSVVDFGVQVGGDRDSRSVVRSFSLFNGSRTRRVVVLALTLEPAASDYFSVLDDLGVGSGAPCGAVVPPQTSLPLTVQLSCSSDTGGIISSWLIATCIPEACCQAPEPEKHCFVVGIRVFAAVLDAQRASDVRTLSLNADAPPFIPAILRNLMDKAPPHFCVSRPPDAGMPAALLAASEVQCAALQAKVSWLVPMPPRLACHDVALYSAMSLMFRLLQLEQAAQVAALRSCDLFNARMERAHVLTIYRLHVPGLPEQRPPVVPGDYVYVRPCHAAESVELAVLVISTVPREAIVVLQFDVNQLPFLGPTGPVVQRKQVQVHVRFMWDGSLFHRATHAMACELQAPGPRPALWPDMALPLLVAQPKTDSYAPMETLYHPSLNEEQQRLVCRVLAGHATGAPHVLFGPPGTGKTMTLVECALHLFHGSSGTILLCAPTPFAADLLCSRLAGHGITPADMVRINDARRGQAEVKSDVLPFCVTDVRSISTAYPCFGMPVAPTQRVWVASCASAALIRQNAAQYARQLPFQAVLIDEAGQASAPEALIPLCFPLTSAHTSIVLAGDPQQLGPICHSKPASMRGLAVSLLERFAAAVPSSELAPWAPGARRRMTVLSRNYRSHADVLALPSRQFYSNALQPCADKDTTSLPQAWMDTHNGGTCRVHFHGVRGSQQRAGESASLYNSVEATAVVAIVEGLIAHAGLQATDFGVIALFRLHVFKLRTLLRAKGLGAVRVGTLDDYQGQEETVIIISTVITSSPRDQAQRGALGLAQHDAASFLANPRRFNVAVTRAKALNIAVGHPVALSCYSHWAQLMAYALAKGTYTGAGAPDEDEGESEDASLAIAVRRLAELSLLGSGRGLDDGGEDGWGEGQFTGEELGFRVAL